jgi:hypothetical protein
MQVENDYDYDYDRDVYRPEQRCQYKSEQIRNDNARQPAEARLKP